jgi:hypothetical protein
MSFFSISAIADANREIGQYFFDPQTMRFFSCHVARYTYPLADGGTLFVTSEQRSGDARRYTIRLADPEGKCGTAPGFEFQQFSTLGQARTAAKNAAKASGVAEC